MWYVLASVLILIIAAAVVLWWRKPGGRSFDERRPGKFPVDGLNDPQKVLAELQTDLDANGSPRPLLLHLALVCKAAYANGEACVPRLFYDTAFDRVVPVEIGPNFAFIGIRGEIAVVAFRGSNEIRDWYTNFQLKLVGIDHGRLHGGFWNAYRAMREAVLAELAAQQLAHVWICGHSLGGALAVCCAYDLVTTTEMPLSGVITYGQPKFVDEKLARHINDTLYGKYLAIVADKDPVADAVLNCHFCGSAMWFTGDDVYFDSGKVEALASEASAPEEATAQKVRIPFFKNVMSREEFEQKQELAKRDHPILPFSDGSLEVQTLRVPFFDDHRMEHYIAKLKTYFAPVATECRTEPK